MIRFYCLVLLLLVGISATAQIVNIENARMHSDTTGWLGNVGISFAFSKNVQEVLNINTAAHLQYKTKKDLYLLLGNYALLKGNNQNLTNNLLFHFRYNRKLSTVVRWEVFTQWQQNTITNIDQRFLIGTGPRFKLYESEQLKLYMATAAMYEYERDIAPVSFHRDLRNSSYVTFTYNPRSFIELVGTTFYQPLFKQLSDFRVLNQLSANFKWNKHFSVALRWDYLYDSNPAAGTPNINYAISNGFAYTF